VTWWRRRRARSPPGTGAVHHRASRRGRRVLEGDRLPSACRRGRPGPRSCKYQGVDCSRRPGGRETRGARITGPAASDPHGLDGVITRDAAGSSFEVRLDVVVRTGLTQLPADGLALVSGVGRLTDGHGILLSVCRRVFRPPRSGGVRHHVLYALTLKNLVCGCRWVLLEGCRRAAGRPEGGLLRTALEQLLNARFWGPAM